MDSAVLAEIVLGRLRIELIKGQLAFTREDLEVRICRRVPERPRSTAHGAVAIDHVVRLGPNLEPDPTAMARALLALNHLNPFPFVSDGLGGARRLQYKAPKTAHGMLMMKPSAWSHAGYRFGNTPR